jgi:hypothetical protein
MRMRVPSLLAAGCLTACVALEGSTPVPAWDVDALVAKHIAARGGYERLAAVKTMRIVRTHGTFGGNIPVVITKARPARLRVEQTCPTGAPSSGASTRTPRGTRRPTAR